MIGLTKKPFSIAPIAILMTLILIVSLIPLFIVAFYSHPAADDFAFGLATAQAWQDKGSLGAVLAAAQQNVQEYYHNWQGTYSGIFLMSLQPGLVGEDYYPVGPIFLLLLFLTGNLFLFKVILMDYFKADKWHYLTIVSVILLLSLQFMYDPVEGFYWFNGGVLYTGFYSLALFLFGFILWLCRTQKPYVKFGLTIISVILCAVIAGGNYPTALATSIILFILTAYKAYRKDKNTLILGFLVLASLTGLLISITAPGNAVRQASVGGSLGALKAILLSFAYGGYSAANSINVPVLIGFVFLTPFLYYIAQKSSFQFRYPILVFLLSFCIYSAQATPPLYALGLSLPERLINIIYYSFYLLAVGNLLYFLGWIARKLECLQMASWKETMASISDAIEKHKWSAFLVICFLFVCASIGRCEAGKGPDGDVEITNLPTTVEAIISLATGEAQDFSAEARQRLELYHDNSAEHIVVPEHTVKPYLLYYGDITDDPNDWRNQAVARYYGKKTIRASE